jgi:hypothetical protein
VGLTVMDMSGITRMMRSCLERQGAGPKCARETQGHLVKLQSDLLSRSWH